MNIYTAIVLLACGPREHRVAVTLNEASPEHAVSKAEEIALQQIDSAYWTVKDSYLCNLTITCIMTEAQG